MSVVRVLCECCVSVVVSWCSVVLGRVNCWFWFSFRVGQRSGGFGVIILSQTKVFTCNSERHTTQHTDMQHGLIKTRETEIRGTKCDNAKVPCEVKLG